MWKQSQLKKQLVQLKKDFLFYEGDTATQILFGEIQMYLGANRLTDPYKYILILPVIYVISSQQLSVLHWVDIKNLLSQCFFFSKISHL